MLEYVHRIAEKVANEPLEDGVLEDVLEDEQENWIVGETEQGHMPLVKKKKKQTEEEMIMPTSEEEFQADLDAQDMRYLHYCREQEEMYNDPVMNWSGLR